VGIPKSGNQQTEIQQQQQQQQQQQKPLLACLGYLALLLIGTHTKKEITNVKMNKYILKS